MLKQDSQRIEEACNTSEHSSATSLHNPVLLYESINALVIKPTGIYVDGTFGRGGHSAILLEKLSEEGQLIVFDKDSEAIACGKEKFKKDKRITLLQSSFADMQAQLETLGISEVDGILLDLGVSSPQLDTAERGFSFNEEGLLDMRMDNTQGITAGQWLEKVSEKELAQVLWQYGDERYSRRIARAIIKKRMQEKITTTKQLAAVVAGACPTTKERKHPATRTFQAIRIVINNELEDLKIGLEQGLALLRKGGRMVVISFHSLEDRIVKQFIRSKSKAPQLPKEIPLTENHFIPQIKEVGRPIKPSVAEVNRNIRARSAILRVMEKV